MTSSAQRWFVVQTRPNSESKATAHLARQGFEVYLPRYLKRRSHARKVDMVSAPLFPRYLFVAFDPYVHGWRSIRSTLGVTQLVCHGDRPVAVADDIVSDLRSREDDKGMVWLDRKTFTPGEKIRVVSGAFCDHLGIFEGMSDRERVMVLLDLLGRKVRVLMGVDVVEAMA